MRKEKTVIIDEEGRDKGKVFLIREMPATKAEKWGLKAIAALAKGGLEIPEELEHMGMAAIAVIGLNAFAGIDFNLAEPLLDEMMECVQICEDKAHPTLGRPLIGDDDIEEIATLLKLRKEVFDLHTGFFTRAATSKSTQGTTQGKKT